ncbi:ABC transporter ATP-binding protein [Zhengella mangrovi]|uniref:ABC transporter ATP-binding protein n=1 Tax=Zhengella mangrovi TaxID=1982044 RepID=A0A2G1QLJ2_9HYPH|nr:sn-glycerol-3-phosphate ABC transporter ATP-binding protein UgpC [Zhengella mangrovi]PHP66339.1 ABC transporter ATP-binding protein [Zhengella mangrovi]
MASVSVKNLDLAFGSVKVLQDLNLDIQEGEFLVLLGSSGCGKSTLLNCIAGLLDITGGQVFINDRNVTWEEPKDRGIGMVFQSYALYPQMTVEGNLSFGLKNAGMGRDEIARRIARAAEILHIEPLLKRKPAQLSGGQRQRVAIGRALVRDVDVFLFDEPLSNLDAKLRAELRVEIKRLHHQLKSTTMIYVTHDQIEALTLADRIAIMRGGSIQQLADPLTIYNKPVNKYVAGFIGSPAINFFEGDLSGSDAPHFGFEGQRVPLQRYAFGTGSARPERAVLGIRPEHVVAGEAAAAQEFRAEVAVEVVEPMGADTLVWSRLGGSELRFRVDGHSTLRPGDRIPIGFDPERASLFDTQTELRV